MKTCQQIMEESNAKQNITEFLQRQKWSYERKVLHAEKVAKVYFEKCSDMGLNTHVSVGGLDSITLHYFLESIGLPVTCISCSTLEGKGVQAVHKQIKAEMKQTYATWYADHGALTQTEIDEIADPTEREREQRLRDTAPEQPRMEFLKPLKTKVQVIQELGFPVVGKAKARKIEYLQTKDSEKQTFIHAIMTGDMGAQGHFEHSEKIKLPDKWIELFGGNYADMRPDLQCKTAPFKVSADCCYWLKEKPCDNWAKAHHSVPYLGLMASEGGQRELGLKKNGCNYWGKSTTRSAPFAIFDRQDILRLALDLNVPIPAEYGEIARKPDGTLYTTEAQRTGCTMCGFGIHMEKRPNRFDRLREQNPKEWEFWMRHVVQDENGEWYGWGRVLDYIGVEWENAPGQVIGQIGWEDFT